MKTNRPINKKSDNSEPEVKSMNGVLTENADKSQKISKESSGSGDGRRWGLRVVKWVVSTIVILLMLGFGLVVGVTLWLTPERLTEIVNREASEYTNANVRAYNVRFTLWSTFPHLCVEADSLRVVSRNFDSLPTSARRELPKDASFLLSTGHLRGGINLKRLLLHEIYLRDVEAGMVKVNLVALNDTLNNWAITKQTGKSKIPYFNIDTLKLTGVGEISYQSIPSSTLARVELHEAELLPTELERNNYLLALGGEVSVNSDHIDILQNFPFLLGGKVALKFKPFGVSTTDYSVRLGNVAGKIGFALNFGEDVSLDRFEYRLDNFSITDLINLLPGARRYPMLKRIDADLNVEATARLLTPYNFSSVYLPSIEVGFGVSDGTLRYTLDDGESFRLKHIGLRGNLVYDGRNPGASYFDVPWFSVSGEGVNADFEGRVTQLTGHPHVIVSAIGNANLQSLTRLIPPLGDYHLSGEAEIGTTMDFYINDGTLYGSHLRADIEGKNLAIQRGGYHVEARRISASTSVAYPGALTARAIKTDIPLELTADISGMQLRSNVDSLRIGADRVIGNGRINRNPNGSQLSDLSIMMKGGTMAFSSHSSHGEVSGISASVKAHKLTARRRAKEFIIPAAWMADSMLQRLAPHTPATIKMEAPAGLKNLMANWDVEASGRIESGAVKMPGLKQLNKIEGVDFDADFDKIAISARRMRIADTEATLTARIGNLRQFLNSRTAAPLLLDIDMSLDTVECNKLARLYADAHPASLTEEAINRRYTSKEKMEAMLIPRNIYARIHAKAKETRYTNLHLYNLDTRLTLRDGLASIDTLHIGADFGHAHLHGGYDTRNLEQMELRLGMGVDDVNVVGFFQNFHKLLLMMPEMKNVSGNISVDADARMLIFPSMYVNVPSVTAHLDVKADSLRVKQTEFIRHVTRMLLLPDMPVLHIADIDMHASVHDNLLELYPFDFEMSKYKLTMEGVNNFDGDIYYHIGVDRWPLRIPFGINIKGSYHHPHLRFGGASWKDERGEEIASGVMDWNLINLVKETGKYGAELVKHAAEYHE